MDTTYGLALTCRSLQLVPFCGVVRGQNLEALCSVDRSSREKFSLPPTLPGEISITSDMQMIPPLLAESEEKLKSLLMKVKEDSEKFGLKLNI